MVDGSIQTPEIRDAERLQGFPANWTAPAVDDGTRKKGPRWRLVGNAVSVPVAEWLGRRLTGQTTPYHSRDERLDPGSPWPKAAWGSDGLVYTAEASMWPVRRRYQHLSEFLRYPTVPLSLRALQGFLSRARRSTLRFPDGLIEAIENALDLGNGEDEVA